MKKQERIQEIIVKATQWYTYSSFYVPNKLKKDHDDFNYKVFMDFSYF